MDSSDKQPDHMTRESRLRRFRRRLSRRAAGSASLPEATSKPDGPVTPPQADSDNAESSHAHGRESREGGETYLEDYKKIIMELYNGEHRPFITFLSNTIAIIRYILKNGSPKLYRDAKEFTKEMPALIPWIMNGPHTDIIPQTIPFVMNRPQEAVLPGNIPLLQQRHDPVQQSEPLVEKHVHTPDHPANHKPEPRSEPQWPIMSPRTTSSPAGTGSPKFPASSTTIVEDTPTKATVVMRTDAIHHPNTELGDRKASDSPGRSSQSDRMPAVCEGLSDSATDLARSSSDAVPQPSNAVVTDPAIPSKPEQHTTSTCAGTATGLTSLQPSQGLPQVTTSHPDHSIPLGMFHQPQPMNSITHAENMMWNTAPYGQQALMFQAPSQTYAGSSWTSHQMPPQVGQTLCGFSAPTPSLQPGNQLPTQMYNQYSAGAIQPALWNQGAYAHAPQQNAPGDSAHYSAHVSYTPHPGMPGRSSEATFSTSLIGDAVSSNLGW